MAPNTSNTLTCLIVMFIFLIAVVSDDCPVKCSCSSRNNGKSVLCSSKGIKNIQINRLPKETVEINLSDNQIKEIRRGSFPFSKKVKKLNLRGNHIQYIEPGSFASFPSLSKLYLQVNELRTIEKGTFSGLKFLKHVNISQNKLLYIHQNAFSEARKLRRISLQQNELTTFQEYTFPNSSKVDLGGNDLICDCDMYWLVKQSKKRGATDGSRCKYPKSLAGKKIKELGGKKWKCNAVEFELPRFRILPIRDQVVFQNDSIELSCASIWQPRGELQWEFDRHSFTDMSMRRTDDLRSRENKTVLYIKRADVNHNGVYVCRALMNNVNKVTKSISLRVVGWQTKFCPLRYTKSDKGKFAWHSTINGATAYSPCPYGGNGYAQRDCKDEGAWDDEDTSRCLHKNMLTRQLDELSKRSINNTSLLRIIADLNNITNFYKRNFTEAKQFDYISTIFARITAVELTMKAQNQKALRIGVASIITNIMEMDNGILKKSEKNDSGVKLGLISTLENFMKESRDRELRHNSEDVPVSLPVTSEIAAYSRSYLPEYPHSLACKVLFKNLSHPRNGAAGSCSKYSNDSKNAKRYDAQLILPKVLFSLSTASILDGRKELTNITFIGYKTPNMFPDSDLTGVESKTENTTINSVIIGVHMQVPRMGDADLVTSDSVVMTFRNLKDGLKPRLIYWSNRNQAVKSTWKVSKKCKLITRKKMYSKFMCSELPGRMTYFAVIVEIQEKIKSVAQFELEFVTYIGNGICCLFLLLTFLTYAAFRELRYNRNDAATLMNLCLALIVAVVLFSVGINRVDNQLLCKAFAVLLHYFLLCCLLWVGCGGACMTSLVRKGPDKEEYNPVLKYYLVGWGLPMIVCGITLAGNALNYDTANFCWLTSQASIGAFIIPGGLIVIINMIIFLRLHAIINRKYPDTSDKSHDNAALLHRNSKAGGVMEEDFHFPDRAQLLDFIKGSLIVMLILCIDCGFTVMIFINRNSTSRYLYHLFSYGFAIANMILGLSVFIFHCVRREDVHICWKSLARGRRRRLDLQVVANENDALIEPVNDDLQVVPVRSKSRASNSEYNKEHSDVISAFSVNHSVFTHDIPSSRPSSIFGPSNGDHKTHRRPGVGKLTLPSYENNKNAQRASESESALQQTVPSAPPMPLAGFAAYPPSTLPETVTLLNDKPGNAVPISTAAHTTATPDFTITTVSERTFSDTSNLVSDIRSASKQHDVIRENVMSDHSSIPSHADPATRPNQAARLPFRGIVAPNWKPVRHGGSSAVFYPYVDPNFKAIQTPAQNSMNSVMTSVSSNNHVQPASKIEPLVPAGPFTIPTRSEVISGIAYSNRTPSQGNQTDQEAKRQSENEARRQSENEARRQSENEARRQNENETRRQSENEARKHIEAETQMQIEAETRKKTESEAPEKKVERVKRVRTANRRRRAKNRTRFDDIPVEKCMIYVPLVQEPPIPEIVRNETSV